MVVWFVFPKADMVFKVATEEWQPSLQELTVCKVVMDVWLQYLVENMDFKMKRDVSVSRANSVFEENCANSHKPQISTAIRTYVSF